VSEAAFSILVVDDDEVFRTILNSILSQAGHLVEWAGNGADAIAAIERRRPDAIFTDIYMPDSDGFELINWLRESRIEIPLIAMSGTQGPLVDHLTLAGRLGADAVLYKPLTAESVMGALANALDRRSGAA